MDTGWVQIFVLLTSVMCTYRRKFDKFRMCLSILTHLYAATPFTNQMRTHTKLQRHVSHRLC